MILQPSDSLCQQLTYETSWNGKDIKIPVKQPPKGHEYISNCYIFDREVVTMIFQELNKSLGFSKINNPIRN